MSAGEIWRRAGIWAVVVGCFAVGSWTGLGGEWAGLIGFWAYPVVGAIILTSRPGNGIGRYLLGVGAFAAVVFWPLVPAYAAAVPAWTESLLWAAAGPFWMLIPAIGPIFPTGRPETRLGRISLGALLTLGLLFGASELVADGPLDSSGRANPLALPGATWPGELPMVLQVVAVAVVMTGVAVDLVRRWRDATVVARLQYRWLVFGVVGLFVLIVSGGLIEGTAPDSIVSEVFSLLATAALGILPISIGIAVTRHGLYEIGRVVSRTVSYAVVTVLALGVYAAVVTSVSLLLPEQSAVPVALATLAAAALFLPALRAAQRLLDRRFDRERYDAENVVDAFGQRLRDGADPHTVGAELLEAADRTLQPTVAGIWTRTPTPAPTPGGER